MCKRIAFLLLLIVVAIWFTGCDRRYPYIRIERDNKFRNDVIIYVDDGYTISRQMYTIDEYDDGYDIIIHCVKAGDTD